MSLGPNLPQWLDEKKKLPQWLDEPKLPLMLHLMTSSIVTPQAGLSGCHMLPLAPTFLSGCCSLQFSNT